MAPELYRQCARMVMAGFPGTSPTDELNRLIDDGLFGAILFKRNVVEARQVAALNRALKERAGRAFLVAVDQEGGRVARLQGPPFTRLPPMRVLGERGDDAQIERAGKLLALELAATGFDWDFAPVLDVDTNPKNPVIGDRSFHRDAEKVARYGVKLARGLEAGGIASCGKHFPGHGDTHEDSHHKLPRLPHDLARLRAVELVPFRAYAEAGLASLMTAHVIFEAVEPGVPATMSARVLQGVLRDELGFHGVLVSDDLEMKAIADHYSIEDAAVQGAIAGIDLFLVCHQAERQRRVIEALVRAVESGALSRARVAEANGRLDLLARRFFHAPVDLFAQLDRPEHHALSAGLSAEVSGSDPTEALG